MTAQTQTALSAETFAQLVGEHQAGLRAFVRSLGAHADSVDDIAQEAFLVAWQKLAQFEPDKDFGKWLRGIARNILLNERTREMRRSRILSRNLTEILDTNYAAPESPESEHSQRLIEALHECMAQLPEKSADLLIERYRDDTFAPDLAARRHMTGDAVRQNLIRIRRKMRECMEKKIGEVLQ